MWVVGIFDFCLTTQNPQLNSQHTTHPHNIIKIMKNKYKAIIFDMDGVIVDSMPYHYISWFETLKPYGISITAFDIYEREGEMWQKSLVDLFRLSGVKAGPKLFNKLIGIKKALFKKYFKRHIFSGAGEILRCIKKSGYRLALVTGTPINEVKKILSKSTVSLFDSIVAGDQVKLGKPDPEPYLKAAKKMKIAPKDCAVVENAPLGIESAKRAGMFCFAVTTSLPRHYLRKADVIVARLEEIMPHICPI